MSHDATVRLWVALKAGDAASVDDALTEGAHVNEAVAEHGWPPLHWTAERGHVDIVRELIDAGANVNAVVAGDWTPLRLAAEHGHTEVVKELIRAGADVDVMTQHGWTLIHWAAVKEEMSVMRELLGAGANVNAVAARDGQTLLHWAARWGKANVVKSLLSAGAKASVCEKNDRRTPLHWAAERGHVDVVKALADAGANVNARTWLGSTPLHLAAENGHVDVAQALIAAGASASLHVRYLGVMTPWQVARDRGFHEMAHMLEHARMKDFPWLNTICELVDATALLFVLLPFVFMGAMEVFNLVSAIPHTLAATLGIVGLILLVVFFTALAYWMLIRPATAILISSTARRIANRFSKLPTDAHISNTLRVTSPVPASPATAARVARAREAEMAETKKRLKELTSLSLKRAEEQVATAIAAAQAKTHAEAIASKKRAEEEAAAIITAAKAQAEAVAAATKKRAEDELVTILAAMKAAAAAASVAAASLEAARGTAAGCASLSGSSP